jgi:hypothetical protein
METARKFQYDFEGGDDPRWIHVPDGMEGEVARKVKEATDRIIREASGSSTDPRPVCPGCAQEALRNAELLVARDFRNSGKTVIPYKRNAAPEDLIAGIINLIRR